MTVSRRLRRENKRGFTILETILVVTLLSLIVVAIAPFFKTTVDGWQLKDRQLELLQVSRVGMDKMVKELKSAVEFTKADPDKVEFKDWAEEEIKYELKGSVLKREGKSLVESVDSLAFTYYDVAGSETSNEDDVYSLKIAMTVSDSEGKVNPMTFTSRVVMRKDPVLAIIYNLAINEINYNPAKFKKRKKGTVAEKKVEWVEVYNYGDTSIDLNGWTLKDTKDSDKIQKQGKTSVISSGGYGLIAAKKHKVDDYYSVDSEAVRFKLNDDKIGNMLGNKGDTVTIKDSDGNIVDSVKYGNWTTQGKSIERIDPESGSSQQNNWQASNVTGSYTPGSENTVTE